LRGSVFDTNHYKGSPSKVKRRAAGEQRFGRSKGGNESCFAVLCQIIVCHGGGREETVSIHDDFWQIESNFDMSIILTCFLK
jgi:hypothetical protein